MAEAARGAQDALRKVERPRRLAPRLHGRLTKTKPVRMARSSGCEPHPCPLADVQDRKGDLSGQMLGFSAILRELVIAACVIQAQRKNVWWQR